MSDNPFSVPLRDYDINPYIHPTMAKDGYGGHIIDIKGIDYVDFMAAWGTNLLGYGYPKVARAVVRQARQFDSLGMPYPQFYQLRDLICRMVPSAEDVRYGKNGSDACAGAVRLARHVTQREKILYHGYHGFHDWYFASTDCPGIPAALKGTVIGQADLSPGAVDAAFREHPGEIAALILNPLTGPYPTPNEIRETIEVIHSHGGLVIFDEMLSGFRVAPGGMQEIWNVKPDLSCFGKAIANGLPLSVLCGKGEYIRRLPETYYGMTFEGEAVSIAAAYATLTELLEQNVVAELYKKGRKIRAEYHRLADEYKLSTSLAGYEPCMHMEFEAQAGIPQRQLLWLMIQELVRNEIFTFGAFIICFSHGYRDLRKLVRAFERSMSVVREAVDRGTTEGLLDERVRSSLEEVRAPANWRRMPSEEGPSDHDLEALYLSACAESIQWVIRNIRFEKDQLEIEGWAIAISGPPEKSQFLVNGIPFDEVNYSLPTPDLAAIFWNIPTAQAAGFACKTAIDQRQAFRDGFIRLEFLDGSEPEHVRRRAWYFPDSASDIPIPEGHRIQRVISAPDSFNYLVGGATVYKRLEHYLEQKFSKPFKDFRNILDWACGCGRVARNFRWLNGTRLCGVDVDGDNIAWCREHLPHGQFLQVAPSPPMPFADESFDLILGIGVLSQLDEDHQFAWLGELKRVAAKDAIVLISVQGLSQLGMNRPHPGILRKIEEKGFVVAGRNSDLDEVLGDQDYYLSVLQSRDYLYRNWGKYFTILEILDGVAANQDLVVMKNGL